MTQPSTATTGQPRKRNRALPPGQKLIDLKIPGSVKQAALARLALVRRMETAKHGTAQTNLADVARNVLNNWNPDDAPRYVRHTDDRVNFRFQMQVATYDRAKDHVYRYGETVAGVVQDALEYFARTGKLLYPPTPDDD